MSNLQQVLDDGLDGAPGAVALVASSDEVEFAASGFVDLEQGAPMQRDTVFRWASITKPVAAALTMILVEDGVFALDSPVDGWLPEIADHRVLRTPPSPLDDTVAADRRVTVEDLLTFRAGWGFPDDFDLPGVAPLFQRLFQGPPEPQRVPPPDEWMALLAEVPALTQPGEAFLYETSGNILGVLLARAAGKPLPELMAERLFEPLRMVDTGFAAPAERLAAYYRPGEDGAELADPPDGQWTRVPAFPEASGGLVGTIDDWRRFGRMLLGKGDVDGVRVLSEESVRAMTTNHLTRAQRDGSRLFLEGQGWGYGGSVDVDPIDPWNVPGRYGWVGGTGTAAHVVPSTGQITILLTQLEMTGPTPPELMRRFWAYAAS